MFIYGITRILVTNDVNKTRELRIIFIIINK